MYIPIVYGFLPEINVFVFVMSTLIVQIFLVKNHGLTSSVSVTGAVMTCLTLCLGFFRLWS